MHPQDETLTPQQQRFVAAILLVIFLAFSSVFAFAYVKGTQVRKDHVTVQHTDRVCSRRFNNMRVEKIKGQCVRIVRGTSVQLPIGKLSTGLDKSRVWTINKFPQHNQNGSLLNPSIISYITSPGEWQISRKGIMTLPPSAEEGFYHVHYWSGRQVHDYFFEVIAKQ